MANCYFLLLVLLEFIPSIYQPGGPLSMATPLMAVVSVSMVKDMIEDRSRYKSDQEENNNKSMYCKRGETKLVKCAAKDIQIGCFVKVMDDQSLPCDIVLVGSSLPKGIAYVETKGLDGETNLKQKQARSEIFQLLDGTTDETRITQQLTGSVVTVDMPNADLYRFKCTIKLPDGQLIPVTNDSVLLKGCQLRNTGHCYGIALYTGQQTKVMKNAMKSRSKQSKMERATNFYIVVIVSIQMVICLFSAAYDCIWVSLVGDNISYLGYQYDDKTKSNAQYFVIAFMLWFIALMNFVSISLLVTLEMIKLSQGYFITQDYLMYDIEKDISAKVQSSNLNEELGMISYIFSDKTGTLTQNIMEFKRFTAGKFSYGTAKPRLFKYPPGITNVNFDDETVEAHLNDKQHENHAALSKFIECLGICHTVISEIKTIKGEKAVVYNASSPDELALVNGMRHFGFFFKDRDEQDNLIIDNRGQIVKYKLLHVIEFTSDRKRMTVIVKTENDEIMIVCKGADSIINARLAPDQSFTNKTNEDLDKYAEVGLRTLLIAYKYLPQSIYEEWAGRFREAETSLDERDVLISACAEEIEVDFLLAGCSAIEDKLQDEVGPTIRDFRKAGIKVWVLTGDKVETAINIGQSCQLLVKEQNWLALQGANKLDLKREINELFAKQKFTARFSAVIVDGYQLSMIQSEKELQSDFVDLCTHDKCQVVLVCRVSPQQKADVVNMVKSRMPEKSMLAIGDGANDVSMITAAQIGIGISGLEGQQAARAADYSIGQFKFLKNLLFCHGREAYRRNAYMISFTFYKNVLYVIPIFTYGIVSNFSATDLYNLWLYQLYNVIFTFLPIFWYSIFDWEFEKQEFLTQPSLYFIGLYDVYFNKYTFWRWFGYAIWQGAFLCTISFVTLDSGMEKDGQQGGLSLDGNFMFLALVMIVNIKVLISSKQITFWACFCNFISIFSFFIIFYFFSIIEVMTTTGEFQHTYNRLQTYAVLILLTCSYILIDNGLQSVNFEIDFFIKKRIASIERQKQKKLKKDKTLDTARYQNFIHSGYAFSGSSGQDRLVTDNLSNRIKEAIHKQMFGDMFSAKQIGRDSINESRVDVSLDGIDIEPRFATHAPLLHSTPLLATITEDEKELLRQD